MLLAKHRYEQGWAKNRRKKKTLVFASFIDLDNHLPYSYSVLYSSWKDSDV